MAATRFGLPAKCSLTFYFRDRCPVSRVVASNLLQPGLRSLLPSLKIRVSSFDRSRDSIEGQTIGLSRELESVRQLIA